MPGLGCSSDSPATSDAGGVQDTGADAGSVPVIVSFTAVPDQLFSGETTSLSWEVASADEVALFRGGSLVADDLPSAGQRTSDPILENTSFTLRATNGQGDREAPVNVVVLPPDAPRVVQFQATPPVVRPGQPSSLTWTTENTSGVSLSILDEVIVEGPPAGQTTLNPVDTSTVVLLGVGLDGTTTSSSAVIHVIRDAAIQEFASSDDEVVAFQTIQLRWSVDDAQDIAISSGTETIVTTTTAQGQVSVLMEETTTFTLDATARDTRGQPDSRSVTVTVVDPEVLVFENDRAAWLSASGPANLIDFDSVPTSAVDPLQGDEFSDNPGAPIFVDIEDRGMFARASNQIPNPPSPPNMFAPVCNPSCEGIIRLRFAQPVIAVGAIFIDVEGDFDSTGLSLDLDQLLPQFPFSSSQGQSAFSFLGVRSSVPFREIDLHFATGPNIDGTLIDNLEYVLAP